MPTLIDQSQRRHWSTKSLKSRRFVQELCFSIRGIAFVAFCFACVGLAHSAETDHVKPLEPDVSGASDEGQQSMAGIKIPDGWKIQLFAAEPDVANVVAFDIDHRGRVFAAESFRQNRGVTDNRAHDDKWLLADLSAETVQDRIDYHKELLGEAAVTYAQHDDRIRRLVDSNGDGSVDQSEVVANGFNHIEEGTGASILVRGSDIYYTCIPKLWKLIDKDDDGKADDRVVLSNGYGVRVAFRGHDLHGLVIGPDGRLYFSIGDRGYHIMTKEGTRIANPAVGAVFRCELDGSGLETFATGLRNPQELAFNDFGDLFSVDNNSDSGDQARIVHILEGGDTGWRMYYQYLPDRGPFNQEKIWEPFHKEQPAYIVPPIANFSDGPSGLTYYPGTGFGDRLKDQFLLCDFRGGPSNSGIRTFQLEPNGAFYKLAGDEELIWTCLATDLAFGPDGALYVSDWVDGWDGLGKGRIYRLTDPEHSGSTIVEEVQEILQSDWKERTNEKLAADLGHVDRRVRFEAQWELASRKEIDVFSSVATNAELKTKTRLHAIWGLDQIARMNNDLSGAVLDIVRPLLGDKEAFIQSAAAKVAGERGDTKAIASLQLMLNSKSARVRYFVVMALGQLKAKGSFGGVVAMLEKNDNADPALRHAGMMYLFQSGRVPDIASLAKHPNVSVRRSAIVALRRLKSPEVKVFLADKNPLVLAEAARAIHDEPIQTCMPDLAACLDREGADLAFVRRALNANFRLGTQEAAERVARFSANATAPQEMRIEALSMLDNWANPDPRDRVLNDYRPLEKRDAKIGATALLSQIDSLMITDATVREKMIDVGSKLGIKKIAPEVLKRVNNEELSMSQRANALKALSRLSTPAAIKVARAIKNTPSNELLSESLTVLARYDLKTSLPKIIDATKTGDTQVQQQAWDILAKSNAKAATDRIKSGLEEYLAGKLNSDVHLNVIEAATNSLPDDVKRIQDHQEKILEKEPLAKWLPSLAGGDVEKGRKLFFENTKLSCVRCHKVSRAGGEVGPNLTTIGKQKDPRYLLEAICLPDAQIAKGFETAVIVDEDAKVHTGIVKQEDDDIIELIRADGTQIRIEQDAIEARRKGKSSMPGDLVKHMSARDLRDLVAYLVSLKVDPRNADDTE